MIVLNLLYAAGVLLMFVLSLIPGTILWDALGMLFPAEHRGRIVFGLRTIMIVGIAAAGVVDRVLRQLLAIVDTVRAGDPFVSGNARRLEAIAWWVLLGEGLRLLIGAIALATTSSMPSSISTCTSRGAVLPCCAVRAPARVRRGRAHAQRPRRHRVTWRSSSTCTRCCTNGA